MLQVDISKRLGEFVVEASFASEGRVTGLFGASGAGKTSLINMIAGLLRPDRGRISIDGETLDDTAASVRVPVHRRRIGYVFQDARLFPHLDVRQNLDYGRRMNRLADDAAQRKRVTGLLDIGHLLDRRPGRLSGGERQRVALGRALLLRPRLLLLDEPLASLDVARREEVLPYLVALRDRLSIPMVYVSHQFDEVLRLATHLVLLEGGRVLAEGAVEEMSLYPELQSIIGPDLAGAVIEGLVTRINSDTGSAELAVGAGTLQVSLREVQIGARVRLQLLARDVILATQPVQGLSVRNALASTVIAISDDEYGAALVRVDVGGAIVLARITQDARRALSLRPGDAVWTLVKAVSTRGHTFTLAPGS